MCSFGKVIRNWTSTGLIFWICLILVGLKILFPSVQAHADPQLGECSGILHADRDSLMIGGGEGEGEGICIINKSQESNVLRGCRIGQFCKIKGVIDECKDSGECSEMLRVTSAERMNLQEKTEAKTTLWFHNGSIVSLVAKGPLREFYYKEPREEMLAVGARPGSLLFSGRSDGKKYVGTAYIFNSQCGEVPYQVSGPILDNFKRVILHGRAPRLGANCRIKGYIDDSLEFTLLQGSSSLRDDVTPFSLLRSGAGF